MNSIHDLGGMDGFKLPERDQGPSLKEEWQRQVWGLAMTIWAKKIPGFTGVSRAVFEQIPPALYLSMPYYARFLYGEENELLKSGLASPEELENPEGPISVPALADFVPAGPAEATALLTMDASTELPAEVEARFALNDKVRVRNVHPSFHTRVPRYTRGHEGRISKLHGVHRFQDHVPENKHPGQHLYTVTFSAMELWGPRGHANDCINVELWETHLEPLKQ